MHLFIGVGLGCILLLSLVREIKQISILLERFPTLMSFIPVWSFFAPTPGMFDYTLMYRDISSDNTIQEWKELNPPQENRKVSSILWHPEKKYSKSLLDITQDLIKFSQKMKDADQIRISPPYLQLLNYVSYLQHDPNTKEVQFMILSNSRMSDYEVLFLSEFHPINSTCPLSL